ncbi:MAG: hypothetical protein F7B20_04745 [Aeropyrum sp.]|nr:hypothetical protein [Aeropyrum sp.]
MRARVLALAIILGFAIAVAAGLYYNKQEQAEVSEATIYLTPECGCCGAYASYLESQGYKVEKIVVSQGELYSLMEVAPRRLWSCHLVEMNGYYVIGHVPVEAIDKLLENKPDVDGIALPGMPPGSPGMPGEQARPFTIYYFKGDEIGVFSQV